MSDIKTGKIFEFTYPFHDQPTILLVGVRQTMPTPGCHKSTEDDGSGWGGVNVDWTANSEGKIVFEVLSIAEMPGKYMDRVIVKKHYLQPDGEKFSNGDVIMMTIGKLQRYIDHHQSVFPCDYEVDESFTPPAPPYRQNF